MDDSYPRLLIIQNKGIIMKTRQAWPALYKFLVWREINKWTQLFDATVIFIHMDPSAASESIVAAHLNHCQLLLSMIGSVKLMFRDKF